VDVGGVEERLGEWETVVGGCYGRCVVGAIADANSDIVIIIGWCLVGGGGTLKRGGVGVYVG
jgi:hypothetical protein